ncbi:MAG: ABC transporter ATP-binding protein [bacterium]
MLKVEKVSVKIKEAEILKDISFTLSAGESVAIIGPNGAGKTTLLRAVAGLNRFSGSIFVNGCNVSTLSFAKRAELLSFVAQIADIAGDVKVSHFLELARFHAHKPWERLDMRELQLIKDAENMTETGEFKNRKIGTLSGGERQRVLIAGAIVQNSPLILLDEPLNYLDPAQREKTCKLIKKISEKGKTVLTVTHEINEAFSFASRIIAIDKGKMVFDGGGDELLNSNVLEEIFSSRFHKFTHPETNKPLVFPIGDRNE